MMRPQLRSTIFPYTTLFRSRLHSVFRGHRITDYSLATSMQTAGQTAYAEEVELTAKRIFDLISPELRDRKSTRLNSSHVEISYAVFCLKKKKNKHIRIRGSN